MCLFHIKSASVFFSSKKRKRNNFAVSKAVAGWLYRVCDGSQAKAFTSVIMMCHSFHCVSFPVFNRYIVIMSNKASRNKNFEAVSKVGTGGSSKSNC